MRNHQREKMDRIDPSTCHFYAALSFWLAGKRQVACAIGQSVQDSKRKLRFSVQGNTIVALRGEEAVEQPLESLGILAMPLVAGGTSWNIRFYLSNMCAWVPQFLP